MSSNAWKTPGKRGGARPGKHRRKPGGGGEAPGAIAERTPVVDLAIEVVMVLMLAFAPFAFGGVDAWAEEVVIALAALAAVVFAVRLWACPRLPRAWVYVPVGLFIALAVFQLLPLPAGVLRVISPRTVALRADLLAARAAGPAGGGWAALSMYPEATRHDLRLLLAAAAVFAIAMNVYARPAPLKRLLVAVAVIGAAMAALTLAQDASGTDRIYWSIEGVLETARAGSFVHYNSFSQFMNMTSGAALALLLLALRQVLEAPKGRSGGSAGAMGRRLGPRQWRAVIGWGMVVVASAAAVVFSLSRGGTLSLLIALGATAVAMAASRRFSRGVWAVIISVGLVFAIAVYFGVDVVFDRLTTVLHFTKSYDGRWVMVKNILGNWRRFPVLGSGLGTHEYVYPMIDRSLDASIATHAENEYLQVFEETGVVGLAIALAFIAGILASYWRAVRAGTARSTPIALGLGCGLIAILIHSFSDFGQHLPANAMLTAVWCAVMWNLGRSGQPAEAHAPGASAAPVTPPMLSRRRLVYPSVLGACVLLVCGWSIVGADRARRAEDEWTVSRKLVMLFEQTPEIAAVAAQKLGVKARVNSPNWLVDDNACALLLAHSGAAVAHQPGSVKYRYWHNVYRWKSLGRAVDRDTGALLIDDRMVREARDIVSSLHQAEKLCPTFGPAYTLAGQLRWIVLKDPQGDAETETGYALSPANPTACFAAAEADLRRKDYDAALEKFTRCGGMGGDFDQIVGTYLDGGGPPEKTVTLAGDDLDLQARLAAVLKAIPGQAGLATRLQASADAGRRAKLEADCRSGDAPAGSLAALAALCVADKDLDRAIALYRRALSVEFGHDDWRLSLAQALAETHQTGPAMAEARTCLRNQPDMAAARKLVGELSAAADREEKSGP